MLHLYFKLTVITEKMTGFIYIVEKIKHFTILKKNNIKKTLKFEIIKLNFATQKKILNKNY